MTQIPSLSSFDSAQDDSRTLLYCVINIVDCHTEFIKKKVLIYYRNVRAGSGIKEFLIETMLDSRCRYETICFHLSPITYHLSPNLRGLLPLLVNIHRIRFLFYNIPGYNTFGNILTGRKFVHNIQHDAFQH